MTDARIIPAEELERIAKLADAMPTGEVSVQEREVVRPERGWLMEYDLCVARYPFATFKTREEVTYHAAMNPAFVRRLLAHIAAQEAVVEGLRERVAAGFDAIEASSRAPRAGTKAWRTYWKTRAALALPNGHPPAARTAKGEGDDDAG